MLEAKNKNCRMCNGQNIVVTRLKGMASVVGVIDQNSALMAEICTDCGEVLRIYAEHKEKLKGRR